MVYMLVYVLAAYTLYFTAMESLNQPYFFYIGTTQKVNIYLIH